MLNGLRTRWHIWILRYSRDTRRLSSSAKQIARLGTSAGKEALLDCLVHPERNVRQAAVRALTTIACLPAAEIVRVYLQAIRWPTTDDAARVIAGYLADAVEAEERLIAVERLVDNISNLSVATVNALALSPERVVALAIDKLREPPGGQKHGRYIRLIEEMARFYTNAGHSGMFHHQSQVDEANAVVVLLTSLDAASLVRTGFHDRTGWSPQDESAGAIYLARGGDVTAVFDMAERSSPSALTTLAHSCGDVLTQHDVGHVLDILRERFGEYRPPVYQTERRTVSKMIDWGIISEATEESEELVSGHVAYYDAMNAIRAWERCVSAE